MLHFCNTPLDLSYRVVVFCCFCATLPDYLLHFCNIRMIQSKFSISGPPGLSLNSPFRTFEPLWRHWNPLKPLSLIEAIEPHWSSTVPLNPLNRSYSRNLMLDSWGSVRSVPKYSNWTHTDVLGTWLSTCSDRRPPQRPPFMYIYYYTTDRPMCQPKRGLDYMLWWPQLRRYGIDLVPKTRYSGGQIKWGHLLMTICCGGLKSPKPHSGVPWPTVPHSGVYCDIQCRGQLIWGTIVCATPC